MQTNSEFNRKILSMISKLGKVTTTTEIAERLGVSWNTAEKHLLELALEGRILRLKKAGVNLWILK
jgi:Mn-dependent DtxR family transcriptional regulator